MWFIRSVWVNALPALINHDRLLFYEASRLVSLCYSCGWYLVVKGLDMQAISLQSRLLPEYAVSF